MAVRVMHLGVHEPAEVEFVSADGRELHVDGHAFTLRRLNGKFVRSDLPYYGVWLSFNMDPRTVREPIDGPGIGAAGTQR